MTGNDQASETSPLLENGKPNQTSEVANDELPLVQEELATAQLALVMSGPWLGCFIAAIDVTVIATLSASISASFNSLSLLPWLASAFIIANAAFQPISGRLTDIFGRKSGLVFSNILFALGNLICGLAQNEWAMILGRIVAGAGGGGLTAIATFVGSDLIPLRKRGLWQGFGNLCFGVGSGIGGLFGGWMNDSFNWRLAFLSQIPPTIFAGILVFFTVKVPIKETETSVWKRIDFFGVFTLISTLVLLLLGLNSGGNVVPWSHPLVLVSLPMSAIFLRVFIYVENNLAVEPIIPVKFLLNRTILAGNLFTWSVSMCTFTVLFYIPIYFQIQGLSPTQAGTRFIPLSIGIGLGSISSGIVMRWTGRYYVANIFTQVLFLTAHTIIATFSLTTPAWEPFIILFVVGASYSSMLTITLLALISAIDQKHHAVITSAWYAFRSSGSVIGIAISSAVFQNILDRELRNRFGQLDGMKEFVEKLRDNLDTIHQIPTAWRHAVLEIYIDALRGVFLTMLGIGVLGTAVSLTMKEHVLHNNLART